MTHAANEIPTADLDPATAEPARRADSRSGRVAPVKLSLRANFLWTMAGNIVYAGCGWGMVMGIAKLGSPEMVGKYALGLAVVSPIMVFSLLNLRAVQATDTKREFSFGLYFALRTLTTGVALTVIVALASSPLYRDDVWVIVATGIASAVDALSDLVYGLVQQRERLDRYGTSLILRSPLGMAAMLLTVAFTGSITAGIAAVAATRLLVYLAYDLPSALRVLERRPEPDGAAKRRLRPPVQDRGGSIAPVWDARGLGTLAWLAFPLGLSMLLNSLTINVPRYFIAESLGDRDLGVFAAMLYITQIGGMIITAAGYSSTPRLAQLYAGDPRAFTWLLARFVAMALLPGAVLTATAVLLGRPLLTFLYTASFADDPRAFVWVAAAGSVGYVSTALWFGMLATRSFRIQIVVQSLVLAATVLGCWLLIPAYGLAGAAAAVLAASVLEGGAGAVVCLCAVLRAGRRKGGPRTRTASPLDEASWETGAVTDAH